MVSAANLVCRARGLRKSMTPEEVKLWVHLKVLNAQGYHFRRQVPLLGTIPDFAELTYRLIIEVDGSQHSESLRDRQRDARLASAGFRVMRVWNIEINTNLDGVVYSIICVLNEQSGRFPLQVLNRKQRSRANRSGPSASASHCHLPASEEDEGAQVPSAANREDDGH
jgi:very-short-patch-repair endonuclease